MGRMDQPRTTYQAPALERGLEILEYLAERSEPIALSDLGRELGKSRNELFRMVVVLERCGYLERTEDERYSLSKKPFDLAMRAPPQHNLLMAALPAMQKLAEDTQQSCHLAVASGADIVVVARMESPDMLGFSLRVGFRRPINLSASGRVLYAFQTPRVQERWRELGTSEEERERWEAVHRDAPAIVEAGFHVTPSFHVDAVTDLVAPVLPQPSNQAVATLVIPYIAGRATRASLTEALSQVRNAAASISRALTD